MKQSRYINKVNVNDSGKILPEISVEDKVKRRERVNDLLRKNRETKAERAIEPPKKAQKKKEISKQINKLVIKTTIL